MRKYPARIKHRRSEKTSLWRIFFIALFLLLLIIFGIKQYQTSKFFAQNQRLNLVLNTNPTLVISFSDNQLDKQIILIWPEHAYLPVSYGYGNYRIESLWQLANLEKKPQIYTDALSDILGLPLHFYINKPQVPILKLNNDNSSVLDFIKTYYPPGSLIFSDNKTNLNFIDKLIMSYKLFSMKGKDISIYKFEDVPYLVSNLVLPDTNIVKEINQEVLDTFMGQKFENSQVRLDGLTIEVQNNTGLSKIGQKFSRYLTIQGAKVIAITNDTEKISTCQLIIKETNIKKSIVNFLKTNFGCEIIKNNDNQNVDVLIKIGESFGLRFTN